MNDLQKETAFVVDGELRTKIETLNQWIKDLQSGMYVNCVYCGYRYGPSGMTPVAMADVLKEHIEQCPEHPMSKLKKALKDIITAYDAGLAFSDFKNHIETARELIK